MKSFATLSLTATLAAAHGIVSNVTVSSQVIDFYNPFTDPYMNPVPERISRAINGNGPVEDVTFIDMQCGANGGNGSAPAVLNAKAVAGETVKLEWTLWPTSHVGPTITYMAKCPDSGCQDYSPGTDAVWFKIQEEGRTGTSDVWGATAVMTAGGSVSYTIPSCIIPGFYLVRHEIIALHSAGTYPGAQLYPSCHQLEVSGSGTTNPSNLVAFPGAYASSDPGITYNVYQSTEEYIVPGPTLFTCGGDSATSAVVSATKTASTSRIAGTGNAIMTSSIASNGTFVAITAMPSVVNTKLATSSTSATATDEDCPVETEPAADDEENCPADEMDVITSAVSATVTPTGASAGSGAASSTSSAAVVKTTASSNSGSNTSNNNGSSKNNSNGNASTSATSSSIKVRATATPLQTKTKTKGNGQGNTPFTASTTAPTAVITSSVTSEDDEEDCPTDEKLTSTGVTTVAETAVVNDEDCPVEGMPTATAIGTATITAVKSATATPTANDGENCAAEYERDLEFVDSLPHRHWDRRSW